MRTKHALELWPKVRPFACCKCPAYFESTAANSYVAVCKKGDGWTTGTDVDGRSVIYCPTHAMPRIEWGEEMAYVRADDLLEPVTENAALGKYIIERCGAEYSARVVAPGFDLLVCDRPPIWSVPGCATYICYFSSEDYTRRLGQAALRCFLETREDWRKARLENRIKYLENLNARLMDVMRLNPGLLLKLGGST